MLRMRAAAIALVSTLALVPVPVFAQAGPPSGGSGAPPQTSSPPPRGAITRDEFVQQRADAAGRLFDEIDASHQGYITHAQLRAFMAQRRAARGSAPLQQQ